MIFQKNSKSETMIDKKSPPPHEKKVLGEMKMRMLNLKKERMKNCRGQKAILLGTRRGGEKQPRLQSTKVPNRVFDNKIRRQ